MNHLSLKLTLYALTIGLCVLSPETSPGQTLADETAWEVPRMNDGPVSYTHLTLPTNREV